MNIKALILATALTIPGVASATNFTQNINVTNQTTGFTQTHLESALATAFTDTFNFNVAGFGPLFSVNSSVISFGTTSAQNIDFTSASLNGLALTIDNSQNAGQLSIAFTPGDFDLSSPLTLVVNGTAGTNATYSGTLNITSAVPEPETYAMLLAGLGLIGFTARRKK
jgi:hypothetical protein